MDKKLLWSIVVVIMFILALVGLARVASKTQNPVADSNDSGIQAVFFDDERKEVKALFSENSVTFTHEALGTMTLTQGISASGARYVNEDESIVFWNKGDSLVITQNGVPVFEGTTTDAQGKLPNGSRPTALDKEIITGSTWVWVMTQMNDDSVVVPKNSDTFSLKFDTEGNLSGTTDCNGFGGEYTIGTDGAISFGPFMSTLMYCEGSQEADFRSGIENSSHYMIDAQGNLILLLKYDSGSVIFKKK